MSLCIGGHEWLAEMANPETRPLGRMLIQDEGYQLLLSSFVPAEMFETSANGDNLPSIVGASFLSKLRGLIIDFSPGKERIGFVPRQWEADKSGVLNPTYSWTSASSAGVKCRFEVAAGYTFCPPWRELCGLQLDGKSRRF
jgi:hypothetical protein